MHPCLAADRPFTESETQFLRYIRQWGKKVVFVVNKVDILSNDREVQEVTRFVGDSATRLLGVERTQVLPVSARAALEAKLAVGGGTMAGPRSLSLLLDASFATTANAETVTSHLISPDVAGTM